MSEQQGRDGSGRFAEKARERDVVDVFTASDEPFLTAPEIADVLGVARQTVTRRLKQMRETGTVARKVAGANAVVWWLADRGEAASSGEIDSADPLFSADPIMSVDMGDESIDDVLYGPAESGDGEPPRGHE